MSATVFGAETKYTKRYGLGQVLSTLTRHSLLMTATPHNGKEEDFQLFMALLDGDRFEGHFRDGVRVADVSDLMRRMVRENLLKFDGTPLFPERIAYTVRYRDPAGAGRELAIAMDALSRSTSSARREMLDYASRTMRPSSRLATPWRPPGHSRTNQPRSSPTLQVPGPWMS